MQWLFISIFVMICEIDFRGRFNCRTFRTINLNFDFFFPLNLVLQRNQNFIKVLPLRSNSRMFSDDWSTATCFETSYQGLRCAGNWWWYAQSLIHGVKTASDRPHLSVPLHLFAHDCQLFNQVTGRRDTNSDWY